ncbi:hypothetical protein, partial [Mycolicibacterium goodii]|uniref:hypothetical protein n=1 Tax=Mycolicibacterium goodii TaxID=134601 RepID=UPI000CBDF8D8
LALDTQAASLSVPGIVAARTLAPIIDEAAEILKPAAGYLAPWQPQGFKPIEWARSESLALDTQAASLSVPGIVAAQLATLDQLEKQGLDLDKAVASIGHSQGILGVMAHADLTRAAEILAISQLIGAAIARQGRITHMVVAGDARPMV